MLSHPEPLLRGRRLAPGIARRGQTRSPARQMVARVMSTSRIIQRMSSSDIPMARSSASALRAFFARHDAWIEIAAPSDSSCCLRPSPTAAANFENYCRGGGR